MSRTKTAQDWLDWAQDKYEQAQERYAWSSRGDSSTMDSYSTLVDLINEGMAAKYRRRAGMDDGSGAPAELEELAKLADQMETLGRGGFAFNPASMVEAAHTIRVAMGQ